MHGSALFTRGETQVLSVTTLGPMNDNQIIDDVTDVEYKRFMHHYNFPPYSVGETGRMGNPGRREIDVYKRQKPVTSMMKTIYVSLPRQRGYVFILCVMYKDRSIDS